MTCHNLHRRLRRLEQVTRRRGVNQLLEPHLLNAMRLEFDRSGKLPEHPLQRAYVLYWVATTSAMRSTVPCWPPDAGAAYEAAQQTLVEAASELNRQLEIVGEQKKYPGALP
jgi:hypothetical protein